MYKMKGRNWGEAKQSLKFSIKPLINNKQLPLLHPHIIRLPVRNRLFNLLRR